MVEKSESGPNILADAIAKSSPRAKWEAQQAGLPVPEPPVNPLHKMAKEIAEGAARAGKIQLPPPGGGIAQSGD
jgi:hypothetical protein